MTCSDWVNVCVAKGWSLFICMVNGEKVNMEIPKVLGDIERQNVKG